MHTVEIPSKNKSLLPLFHINACSLNKIFDPQHLLSGMKNDFDIIG